MPEPDITKRLRGEDRSGDIVSPNLYDCHQAADRIETMSQILDDLETSIRMGGLAGSPHTLAFVWAQNRDAILNGETTWEAQWGPHRRRRSNAQTVHCSTCNDQGIVTEKDFGTKPSDWYDCPDCVRDSGNSQDPS